MARIRNVKPSFFRHRGLYLAERESGLPLRVGYEGLWCVADREGRFKWDPDDLKLQCLPWDDLDFAVVLDALAAAGFIVKYTAAGKTYGCIPTFKDHQYISKSEPASVIPARPDPVPASDDSHTRTIPQPDKPETATTPAPLDLGQRKQDNGKDEETRATLRVVGLFDRCRTEAFGESQARPCPAGLDYEVARKWLAAGADEPLLEGVFQARMRRMAHQGRGPPNTLEFLSQSVADAIATRNQPMPQGHVSNSPSPNRTPASIAAAARLVGGGRA